MYKSILRLFICFLSGFLIGCLMMYYFNKKVPQIEYITATDTCYITDTVTISKFINHNIYKYDTIIINDTVYIKDNPQVYSDSTEQYSIEINAVKLYDYRLDIYRSDTVYREKIIMPSERTKKGSMGQFIGVGIGANYGLCINPYNMQASFQPSIGIGIVYGWGYRW